MKKRILKNENKESGFTFVETLAVLAIGAILTAGAGVGTSKIIDLARKTKTVQSIQVYKSALQTYFIDNGKFPTTEQGLNALWEKPWLFPIPESWNGPYIDREAGDDPWGNPFVYVNNAGGVNSEGIPEKLPFGIISYGKDGKKGGSGINDDICSWK